jgi:hypothetical protein
VLLLALGSAGGAYLYYHESVTAVAAHTKDVKVAQKALHIVGRTSLQSPLSSATTSARARPIAAAPTR